MPKGPANAVLQHLRNLQLEASAGTLSDSLGSFTAPSVAAAVALFVAAVLVRN